jgi:glucose-1-phosphate thymidylyltransferase
MTTGDPPPPPIAIVPAAGYARRLGSAGSKAALPVGSRWSHERGHAEAEPLAGCLLDRLDRGGVREAIVARRAGGWDLAAALGGGHDRGVRLTYLVVAPTPSVAHTIARAAVLARDRDVVLGFPDVLFEPADAFARILRRRRATGAAIVLGLFPTERPSTTDMVVLDVDGRPVDLVLTPSETTLDYAWLLAAWTREATAFLERWIRSDAAAAIAATRELRIGDVMRAAIHSGLQVEAEAFPEGRFLDVATPDDLARARSWFRG